MSIRLSQFQGFGVEYYVGVDGLSLPLIVYAGLMTLLSVDFAQRAFNRSRNEDA